MRSPIPAGSVFIDVLLRQNVKKLYFTIQCNQQTFVYFQCIQLKAFVALCPASVCRVDTDGWLWDKSLGGLKEKVFEQVRCYFTKYINAKERCQRVTPAVIIKCC